MLAGDSDSDNDTLGEGSPTLSDTSTDMSEFVFGHFLSWLLFPQA